MSTSLEGAFAACGIVSFYLSDGCYAGLLRGEIEDELTSLDNEGNRFQIWPWDPGNICSLVFSL